ncbi:unnamed protein product [Darwinula stevensoni]|uniref:Uncharacterized protein n=1 Tax=Darwinula stevensoni TaxID=69355 RepID=A0A7R8X8H5_9CRUS|nr:unnamed protein product [Darwinula stevensoni]CAG0889693.1 unnamed protein product [Darwinula stevensoni]
MFEWRQRVQSGTVLSLSRSLLSLSFCALGRVIPNRGREWEGEVPLDWLRPPSRLVTSPPIHPSRVEASSSLRLGKEDRLIPAKPPPESVTVESGTHPHPHCIVSSRFPLVAEARHSAHIDEASRPAFRLKAVSSFVVARAESVDIGASSENTRVPIPSVSQLSGPLAQWSLSAVVSRVDPMSVTGVSVEAHQLVTVVPRRTGSGGHPLVTSLERSVGAMPPTYANCSSLNNYIPDTEEIIEALGSGGVSLYAVCALVWVFLLLIYVEETLYLLKRLPADQKSPTLFVLAAYPGVGLTSLLSLIVPKGTDIYFSAGQMWLSVAMYQFLRLTLRYYGGEKAMLERVSLQDLPLGAPPCGCCCRCFCPSIRVTRKGILFMKLLIVQLPFSQAVLYLLSYTLLFTGHYNKSKVSLSDGFIYIGVLHVASTMTCIWGFAMLLGVSRQHLRHLSYTGKYLVLWIILVLKFQDVAFAVLGSFGVFPCFFPVSPTVFANLILQALMLGELLLLSLIARYLYLKPPIPLEAEDSHCALRPEISSAMNYRAVSSDPLNLDDSSGDQSKFPSFSSPSII